MTAVFAARAATGERVDAERAHRAFSDAGESRAPATWIGSSGRVTLARSDDRSSGPWEGVYVIADLRLDNRDDIAAALARDGAPVDAGTADEELVARWFRARDVAGLGDLEGDFAIVLWDERTGRLVAARDCFGMRPLYWRRRDRSVELGSTPRHVLGRDIASAPLDEDTVSDYLYLSRRLDPSASFYRDLRLVRPSHALVVDDRGLDEIRLWQWREPTELRYANRDDYAEQLADELGRAVRARIRGNAPVGIALSGGLDSSAIAAFAAPACDLRAYSMVFDDHPDCDEREYIRPQIERYDIPWLQIRPERETLFEDVPEVDEPDASLAVEPHWRHALRDLAGAGGRVMLGGDGGETLMLSESDWHFIDWAMRGKVRTLARELPAHIARWGVWPRLRLRSLLGRRMPGWIRTRAPVALSDSRPTWLDASADAWHRRLARMRARVPEVTFRSAARQLAFDTVTSDLGMGMGWWPAAAHQASRYGLAYAYPFMDRRLQQFLYAVPIEVFFRDGRDRAVLRDALAGLAPDSVRNRTTQTVFTSWFGDLAASQAVRGRLESVTWPTISAIPPRERALAAAAAGEAQPWQVLCLTTFVDWYTRRQ